MVIRRSMPKNHFFCGKAGMICYFFQIRPEFTAITDGDSHKTASILLFLFRRKSSEKKTDLPICQTKRIIFDRQDTITGYTTDDTRMFFTENCTGKRMNPGIHRR